MREAEAFERALRDNPDDLAGWCAYADYLVEQGDPRGEFMQVQIALEGHSRPRAERDALKKREVELLAKHEREWLGELAPYLLDRDGRADHARPAVEYWWARGFVSEVRVEYLTFLVAQAFALSPAARFLRKFQIDGPMPLTARYCPGGAPRVPRPAGVARDEPHFELIGAPCLSNLRIFQIGTEGEPSSDPWAEGLDAPGIEHVVVYMPRVEELYLLCNGYDARALFALPNLSGLQTLRVYGLGDEHGDNPEVPLDALARNPVLGALTHLLVHPRYAPMSFLTLVQVEALVNSPHLKNLSHLQLRLSDMGDEGVRAIIGSGVVKRLGWLDLRNGTITDYGAKAFADYAPMRNLRRLDLSRNRVTHAGLNMLKRAGVNAVADNAISRRESERREREEREVDME